MHEPFFTRQPSQQDLDLPLDNWLSQQMRRQ
jgi:hypothetical protein